MLSSANLLLKRGHSYTLTGPKGGLIRGNPLYKIHAARDEVIDVLGGL